MNKERSWIIEIAILAYSSATVRVIACGKSQRKHFRAAATTRECSRCSRRLHQATTSPFTGWPRKRREYTNEYETTFVRGFSILTITEKERKKTRIILWHEWDHFLANYKIFLIYYVRLTLIPCHSITQIEYISCMCQQLSFPLCIRVWCVWCFKDKNWSESFGNHRRIKS